MLLLTSHAVCINILTTCRFLKPVPAPCCLTPSARMNVPSPKGTTANLHCKALHNASIDLELDASPYPMPPCRGKAACRHLGCLPLHALSVSNSTLASCPGAVCPQLQSTAEVLVTGCWVLCGKTEYSVLMSMTLMPSPSAMMMLSKAKVMS